MSTLENVLTLRNPDSFVKGRLRLSHALGDSLSPRR